MWQPRIGGEVVVLANQGCQLAPEFMDTLSQTANTIRSCRVSHGVKGAQVRIVALPSWQSFLVIAS
ncbi:UNVERIFIED_CONTAM: hypothetical protein FKN15_075613 [Acipenser sinensis]